MENIDKILKLEEAILNLSSAKSKIEEISDVAFTGSLEDKISAAIIEAKAMKDSLVEQLIPTYNRGEASKEVIKGIFFSTVSGGTQVRYDNLSGFDVEVLEPQTNITRTVYNGNYRIVNSDTKSLIFTISGKSTEVKIIQ